MFERTLGLGLFGDGVKNDNPIEEAIGIGLFLGSYDDDDEVKKHHHHHHSSVSTTSTAALKRELLRREAAADKKYRAEEAGRQRIQKEILKINAVSKLLKQNESYNEETNDSDYQQLLTTIRDLPVTTPKNSKKLNTLLINLASHSGLSNEQKITIIAILCNEKRIMFFVNPETDEELRKQLRLHDNYPVLEQIFIHHPKLTFVDTMKDIIDHERQGEVLRQLNPNRQITFAKQLLIDATTPKQVIAQYNIIENVMNLNENHPLKKFANVKILDLEAKHQKISSESSEEEKRLRSFLSYPTKPRMFLGCFLDEKSSTDTLAKIRNGNKSAIKRLDHKYEEVNREISRLTKR